MIELLNDNVINKNIILFGASKAGEKLYGILKEFNIKIKYFVDNDPNKIGKTLFDKKIFEPNKIYEINKDEDIIVISSMYIGEISEQLDKMGFKGLYYDMYGFLFNIIKDSNLNLDSLDNRKSLEMEREFLISLPRGFALGGLEIWTLNIYRLLQENNKNVSLLSLSNSENTDLILANQYNYDIIDCSPKTTNYVKYLKYIMNVIDHHKPNVVIPNVSEEVFLACNILIKKFNREFRVVSILHSDTEFSYLQSARYENIIDKFVCVSEEIKKELVKRFPHRVQDIYALITPIRIEKYSRIYSNKENPIKLGYVGRLVKPDKRADLLLNLIEELEKRKVKYKFDIVGIGEYYEIINKYIREKRIENKVRLVGGLPNSQVYEFWRDKDIFINVSDLEGTSISMLEGLYNGAVPVLTDVSGVRKFVTQGVNGFVVSTGDIESMVDYIQYLDKNRDLLRLYGDRIHKKVSEICNPDKFIEEFIKICEVY